MNCRYDYAISTIRLISMLMIITCHFMQYMDIQLAWWFNVGVQIFFVISGFLYGRKSIEKPIEFYKRAFVKILIPYWAFIVITAIIQRIIVPDVFSFGKTLLSLLCVEKLDGLEHLWFVQKILICYLLLPLLLLIKNEIIKMSKFKALVSTLFVLLMLQFVGFVFNGYNMSVNNITCFAVGIALYVYSEKTNSLILPTIIFIVIAVLSNAFRIYVVYIKGVVDNQLINFFVKYAHGFLGIALFLLLYLLFRNVKGNVLLRFSDKYSYCIYLVHQVFILGPLSLMNISSSLVLNIVIICVCIFVSGVILKQVSGLIERLPFRARHEV